MEPITHFLTGACIGRAGLNRKTAYATLAGVLAAEAADLDVVWSFAGPVESLKHHRGITHTFVCVPLVAAVVVGAVWLLHRFWRRRKQDQPVQWGWLYLTAFLASLSHLALDWTNNYGVRPFFPFNPRWYAGSIVFIAEPIWWALLLLAMVMPWLLGLTDREIGVKKQRFRGQGWAIFALGAMFATGCWRWMEQSEALTMLRQMPVTSEPVQRTALEPYPINPYRWHAILETRDFYQMAEISTWDQSSLAGITSDSAADVLYKPAVTPAVETAKRTFMGRVFLDWGTWALVRDVGPVEVPGLKAPELPPGRNWTTVEFSDLRFQYSYLSGQTQRQSPLGGWVYVVDGRQEAGEGMGRREQSTESR